MIDAIVAYFTQYPSGGLFARIVMILFTSVLSYIILHYSRKRNINWLSYIELSVIFLMFCLSFSDIPNFKFYVYCTVALLMIIDFIIFAPDISRDLFRMSWKKRFYTTNSEIDREDLHKSIGYIVRACQNLSKNDTGALIVISDNMNVGILQSGTDIHAKVSSELLETIFFPKTPLHDGAVIISADTVLCAGCYLPISQTLDLPKEFGTRHRAAIGISQDNPTATAIVVSEETGIMSAMYDGKIKRYLDAIQLTKILEHAYGLLTPEESDKIWGGKIQL
jgi:diadenylate cyclase